MPNLEMQMRRQLGIRHAHFADDLTFRDGLLRAHVGTVERTVDRVIASAMIDDHGETVRPERPDVHHASGSHGGDARADGRADADAVPPNGRVARRLRLAERVYEGA